MISPLHVARGNRSSLINYIFVLALIFFTIMIQAACRLLEKKTDRYCYVVSVYDKQRGVDNVLKRVELCSRSAPFTWEFEGNKESFTCSQCQVSETSHVPINKLPFQFKVNDMEFTLTETSLKGGGKQWSLVSGSTLNIDIDKPF